VLGPDKLGRLPEDHRAAQVDHLVGHVARWLWRRIFWAGLAGTRIAMPVMRLARHPGGSSFVSPKSDMPPWAKLARRSHGGSQPDAGSLHAAYPKLFFYFFPQKSLFSRDYFIDQFLRLLIKARQARESVVDWVRL
jgi:hypothetical protein